MAFYQRTGDPYIDGLLVNLGWDAPNLTFSFPTSGAAYSTYPSSEPSYNFEVLNSAQMTAGRAVLANYSSVCNLTFSEISEAPANSAIIRFAESDMRPTAWGYMPTTNAKGGDVWFNNSSNYYDNPIKGNYAWDVFIHELGHAMGLKHPHEASGFGVLPIDHDSMEYTVMSYRSYEGASITSGYSNETYGFAQTLMTFDIAALQHMYGANYTHNNSDTVYDWSRTTGEMSVNGVGQGAAGANRIFMTLWDGGGADTYDLSNYTVPVTIDLQPGGWVVTANNQRANLGDGHLADGNIASALLYHHDARSLIENAIGGSAVDHIIGNAGDNVLRGNGGNDTIEGGRGSDVAVYSGPSADYAWQHNADGSWTINGPDGDDRVIGVEVLQFADAAIVIGTPEPAWAPLVLSANEIVLRHAVAPEDTADVAAHLDDGLTFDDYVTSLFETAQDSTLPALIVYDYVFAQAPDDGHLDAIAGFVAAQIASPGYQATLVPRLGGYEAMGLGCSESTEFARFTLASRHDMVVDTYIDLFARAPSNEQVAHFEQQIEYLAALYDGAGLPNVETRARGAVVGQMIGYAAEEDGQVMIAAQDYLRGLIDFDFV